MRKLYTTLFFIFIITGPSIGQNVGIGNSNPKRKLDVTGTTYIRNASGTNVDAEQLRLGRSDNDIRYHSIHTRHGSAGNNYLQFQIHDGGSSPYLSQDTVMTLRGNGNVGIGSTSPQAELNINKGELLINNIGSSTPRGIVFTEGASDDRNFEISYDGSGSGITNQLNFTTDLSSDSIVLSLMGNGNVGIGTSAPQQDLHVAGFGRFDNNVEIYNGSTRKVQFNESGTNYINSGKVGIGNQSPNAMLDVSGRVIADHFRNHSGNAGYNQFIRNGNGSVLYLNQTNNSNSILTLSSGTSQPNNGVVYEVENNGSTGIGLGGTSPSSMLHVNGDARLQNGTSVNEFSTDGTFAANSDNKLPTEKAVKEYVDGQVSGIDEWALNGSTVHPLNYGSRNVGIGTNNAGFPLKVNGKVRVDESGTIGLSDLSNAHLQIGASLGFDPNEIMFNTTGHIGTVSNDDLKLTVDGKDKAHLKPSGRFGIGTSSPQRDLHVAGYGRFDNNVEIFNGSTRKVQFNENGSNYINSGNVGIGSTSPQAELNINKGELLINNIGSSTPRGIVFTEGGSNNRNFEISYDGSGSGGDNKLDFKTNTGTNGTLMTLQASGKIGMGKSTPVDLLHIKPPSTGATEGIFIQDPSVSGYGARLMFNDAASEIVLGTRSSGTDIDAIRIDRDNGNVGVGTSPSSSYKMTVNGKFNSSGITETSDKRLKKDIQTLQDALGKIESLRGVSYNWRTEEYPDKNFDSDEHIGVVAQEVEKVLPEVVHTDNEGYKSVEYSHLVPVLIEAIKEQQEIINEQQKVIDAKSKQDARQQQQIEALQQAVRSLQKSQSQAQR